MTELESITIKMLKITKNIFTHNLNLSMLTKLSLSLINQTFELSLNLLPLFLRNGSRLVMELQEKNRSEDRNHSMMSSLRFHMEKTLLTHILRKTDAK